MQFMIMFYEPAEIFVERTRPGMADYWTAWAAYLGALQGSGDFVSGSGLEPPPAAATVRVRNGAPAVEDGPVVSTGEQLGGYAVMELPDLDAALRWAARAPAAAYGAVEVRPVLGRQV
jgi:hypothetical protein